MPISIRPVAAWGRAIAAGRMLAGMKQVQLAREAGICAATVSKVENGIETRLETLKALRKALRARGVTVCCDVITGVVSAAITVQDTDYNSLDYITSLGL